MRTGPTENPQWAKQSALLSILLGVQSRFDHGSLVCLTTGQTPFRPVVLGECEATPVPNTHRFLLTRTLCEATPVPNTHRFLLTRTLCEATPVPNTHRFLLTRTLCEATPVPNTHRFLLTRTLCEATPVPNTHRFLNTCARSRPKSSAKASQSSPCANAGPASLSHQPLEPLPQP